MIEIYLYAMKNAIEFQRVLLEYRMCGIEPSMSEIRQLSATTKLTMAGAARKILKRKIREAS